MDVVRKVSDGRLREIGEGVRCAMMGEGNFHCFCWGRIFLCHVQVVWSEKKKNLVYVYNRRDGQC